MHLFEGSQQSAVLACLVMSLLFSFIFPSLSCLVVVCGCALCVCVEVAHSPKFPSEELELNSFIRYSE